MHADIEDLLRELAPQVLGILVRCHEQFDACEDAVQEALLAGPVAPAGRTPEPAGLVAHRRRREATAAALVPPDETTSAAADEEREAEQDDTLTLLFLCCHPSLSPTSQVALTLRAVGGLTTAQIAPAFLVPEAMMAQRISRAKQRIKATGSRFRMPNGPERADRLRVVLHVLDLIFNEGNTATSGPELRRADLSAEAIRLTRMVHRLQPDDGKVAGLLALITSQESGMVGPAMG